MRPSTLLFHLTKRLLYTKWRDAGEEPKLHLFGQLKRITKQWLDTYLVCKGGTYPAQLMYQELADMACERITAGITRALRRRAARSRRVLDPYNPTGSTRARQLQHLEDRPLGDRRRAAATSTGSILDSDWEAEFCRVAEAHPRVRAYVKNHNLGFEVPYRFGSRDAHVPARLHRAGRRRPRRRRPAAPDRRDQGLPGRGREGEEVDDGDLLGARREPPAATYGRWAFAEFTDVYQIEADFEAKVRSEFDKMIETAPRRPERGADAWRRNRSNASRARPSRPSGTTRTSGRTSRRPSTSRSVEEDRSSRSASPTSAATATSIRSSSGAARTSRTGARKPQRAAERRAARNTQRVWIGQRVAQQSLEQHPGEWPTRPRRPPRPATRGRRMAKKIDSSCGRQVTGKCAPSTWLRVIRTRSSGAQLHGAEGCREQQRARTARARARPGPSAPRRPPRQREGSDTG